MNDSNFFDPLQFILTLGVIVLMMVGLFGIWNNLKTRQRESHDQIQQQLNRQHDFFVNWIQRIEDVVYNGHSRDTLKPE